MIRNTKHELGICPVCSSENLDYDTLEWGACGEYMYYPATCEDCGATFEECHELRFTGYNNIREKS